MPAGHKVTATNIDAILDQIDSLTAPGWTSYTPVWAAAGTQPAIGNGTIAGRFRRAAGGDLMHFTIRIVMGSTTTYGTSVYEFGLPTSTNAPTATGYQELVGYGTAYDVSSAATYGLTSRTSGSNRMIMGTANGPGSVMTPTVPFTLATGDIIVINGFYEPQ